MKTRSQLMKEKDHIVGLDPRVYQTPCMKNSICQTIQVRTRLHFQEVSNLIGKVLNQIHLETVLVQDKYNHVFSFPGDKQKKTKEQEEEEERKQRRQIKEELELERQEKERQIKLEREGEEKMRLERIKNGQEDPKMKYLKLRRQLGPYQRRGAAINQDRQQKPPQQARQRKTRKQQKQQNQGQGEKITTTTTTTVSTTTTTTNDEERGLAASQLQTI